MQHLDRVASRITWAGLAEAQRLVRERRPTRIMEFDFSTLPKPTSPDGADSGSRIVDLQHALRRLGYDPGLADGILGARTSAAIRAFQADVGLPVTGRVSERLEFAVRMALVLAGNTLAQRPSPMRPVLERESTGSGFRISAKGHVLTNAHKVWRQPSFRSTHPSTICTRCYRAASITAQADGWPPIASEATTPAS